MTHDHEAIRSRVTHDDEYGTRTVEVCECGAHRTIWEESNGGFTFTFWDHYESMRAG